MKNVLILTSVIIVLSMEAANIFRKVVKERHSRETPAGYTEGAKCGPGKCPLMQLLWVLIVLGFNDTSTLEGHFVSSPRER